MKLWPPDENFCTVTNNRKQNLPKNKIFQQKKKKKKKKKASKIYFVKVKSFLSSRISYLRCYFHDLFTNIRVKAAMLPIM